MTSVIYFDDDCIQVSQKVKQGKAPYAIFVINQFSNSCIPHHPSSPLPSSPPLTDKEQWEHFAKDLPKDNCAYGIIHFKYLSPTDGVKRSKNVILLWAPSGASVKEKMMAAFSSKGIGKEIGGGGIRVQAEGAHELEYEDVLNQVLSRCTVK